MNYSVLTQSTTSVLWNVDSVYFERMYLGKVGNIRSANAWLAYSADTPAPHTLEFLLMFHFVIFSEKSPFVDIETVFGKIHIFSIHFTIHSSFLDLGKCLCFPLSLWRDSKNLSFLLCLRPHWIFACNPHWTLRGHLHLDIGLNVNFRALSALVVVVYVYWNTPNRQKKKR